MTRQNADDTNPDVRRFIFIPMCLLLGMVIAGAIVDSQLRTGNTFAIIFTAFGGFQPWVTTSRRSFSDEPVS